MTPLLLSFVLINKTFSFLKSSIKVNSNTYDLYSLNKPLANSTFRFSSSSFYSMSFKNLTSDSPFSFLSSSPHPEKKFIFIEIPLKLPVSKLLDILNSTSYPNLIFIIITQKDTDKLEEEINKITDYSLQNIIKNEPIYKLDKDSNLIFRLHSTPPFLQKQNKEDKENKKDSIEIKEEIEINVRLANIKTNRVRINFIMNKNILESLNDIQTFINANNPKFYEHMNVELIIPFLFKKEFDKSHQLFEKENWIDFDNEKFNFQEKFKIFKLYKNINIPRVYTEFIYDLVKLERCFRKTKPELNINKHLSILIDFISGYEGYKKNLKKIISEDKVLKCFEEKVSDKDIEGEIVGYCGYIHALGFFSNDSLKPVFVNDEYLRFNSCQDPLDIEKCEVGQKICEVFKDKKLGNVCNGAIRVSKEHLKIKNDENAGHSMWWVYLYIVVSICVLGFLVGKVRKQQSKIDVMRKNYTGIFSSSNMV